MNYRKRNLKISVWNINGYICKGNKKFKDPYVLEKVSSNDIFCLLETHCDPDQCLSLDEFPNPVHLVRSKNKFRGKRFRGLSIYIKSTIRPVVKFLEHATSDYIWLKLNKSYFGLREDICICFEFYILQKIRLQHPRTYRK